MKVHDEAVVEANQRALVDNVPARYFWNIDSSVSFTESPHASGPSVPLLNITLIKHSVFRELLQNSGDVGEHSV
jgi:hypothetical protein